MPDIEEVRDRASESVPTVEEMRKSQDQGGKPGGLPENKTGRLNECQGHEADIRE
jgi:hypothetical protein